MADEAVARPEPTIADAYYQLIEMWTVRELVEHAGKEGEWCCPVGCGNGACEGCPCCDAGYCVGGVDGIPTPGTPLNPYEDEHSAYVWRNWLEIASEHNPVVKALADQAVARTAVEAVLGQVRALAGSALEGTVHHAYAGCALMLERLLSKEPGTPGFQRIGGAS